MTETNLKHSVSSTVSQLQRDYLERGHTPDGAQARGALAELRKSVSRSVEHDPLSLQRVLMTMNPPLSDAELGHSDAMSPSEKAAFHALALFGLHMQSASAPVHIPTMSFANACGQLYRGADSKSIKLRFDAMQAAGSEETRIIHLRSLITLLRSQQLGFHYGQFAVDLRNLTHPERRTGVLLRWGRDFAVGARRPSTQTKTEPTS